MIKIDTTIYSQMLIDAHRKAGRKLAMAYYIALRDIGAKNVQDIKNNIRTAGGEGRTYTKRIRGRVITKQASSQGQYPISWSGTLKRSNQSKINNPTSLTIFNSASYAYHVENKSASRGGRQFMINTIRKNETNTRNILFKRVDQILSKL